MAEFQKKLDEYIDEAEQEEKMEQEIKEEKKEEKPEYDFAIIIKVSDLSEGNFGVNIDLGKREGVSLYEIVGVLENAKNEMVMQMFLRALSSMSQPQSE